MSSVIRWRHATTDEHPALRTRWTFLTGESLSFRCQEDDLRELLQNRIARSRRKTSNSGCDGSTVPGNHVTFSPQILGICDGSRSCLSRCRDVVDGIAVSGPHLLWSPRNLKARAIVPANVPQPTGLRKCPTLCQSSSLMHASRCGRPRSNGRVPVAVLTVSELKSHFLIVASTELIPENFWQQSWHISSRRHDVFVPTELDSRRLVDWKSRRAAGDLA